MAIDNSLPSPAQIEVTLFGPGYGESVLVHLGSNRWAIIDSCIEPQSRSPAALEYLAARGVNPEEAVVLVASTHWHDDHIRGLSDVVRICENARFACPLAFRKEEFIGAVSRFNVNNGIAGGSGVQELWKIYHLMVEGRRPKLASAGMELLSISGQELGHGQPVKIDALSPSDHQVDKFLLEIAQDLPQFKMTKFRAVSRTPNESALVILVQIGPVAILLGADLEEEGDPNVGWSAVIRDRGVFQPKAAVYKVAHHGSITAHHDQIWTELLIETPFALLTPWNRAKGLPTGEDIKRLVELTEKGYITAVPKQAISKVKRDPAVERTIQETVGGKLRRAQPSFGTLRLRTIENDHSQWHVELSDTASPLNRLVTAA